MQRCILDRAIEEARNQLGFNELKDKQLEAIVSFVGGQDTFVLLPTGYGKSVIYSMLPVVFDKLKGCSGSIVVCVSPLTAIMMDQKTHLLPRGLVCEFVGAAQYDDDVVDRVLAGIMQLVFISPENLIRNDLFRTMLLSQTYQEWLVALVVDEAHCVKTWGDEFRVDFAALGSVRSLVPDQVNVMALSATATRHTFESVVDRLSMDNVSVVGLSPMRENIRYAVRPMTSLEELSAQISMGLKSLRNYYPKTIIFCRRYNDCTGLYKLLESNLNADLTHPSAAPNLQQYRLVDLYTCTSASTAEMKGKLLTAFTSTASTLRVLIATTAFGMGIDCPDIRWIVHWGPPSLVEEYVQEAGRAGRDGAASTAVLMYGRVRKDISDAMKNYGENGSTCRSRYLYSDLLFFDSALISNTGCSCCDICASSCHCGHCQTFDLPSSL